MKTYLVEEWNPDIEFDEDSLIVALTPKVCYQLDKAGIKYSIIEDYYDEAELTVLEDEYHKSQLRWIESLDEFLQNNVKGLKELNLKLGTLYYYFLKTIVLDPLYIRCYTLNRLFEAIKPSSVVLLSPPAKEMPLDFTLQSNGGSGWWEPSKRERCPRLRTSITACFSSSPVVILSRHGLVLTGLPPLIASSSI